MTEVGYDSQPARQWGNRSEIAITDFVPSSGKRIPGVRRLSAGPT
jgi:hypothetical protein